MFCAVNVPKSCLELYYFKDKIQHIIQCKVSLSGNFSSHFLTEVVLVLSINEVIIATGFFSTLGVTILLTVLLHLFVSVDFV